MDKLVLRLKVFIIICLSTALPATAVAAQALSFEVIETRNHDEKSFTQGLELHDGVMLESSGLYGRSYLRKYTESNNKILQQTPLPNQFFAEGLTKLGDKVYLLTWQKETLFVFNYADLTLHKTLSYEGQGWGICHDGESFYTSDGSHQITKRDSKTFSAIKKIKVATQGGQTIHKLNELECAQDALWANRWQYKHIYRIAPHSGEVTGILDLTDLVPFYYKHNNAAVLNGIAYDQQKKAFWVTGKNWNKRFLIRIFEPAQADNDLDKKSQIRSQAKPSP